MQLFNAVTLLKHASIKTFNIYGLFKSFKTSKILALLPSRRETEQQLNRINISTQNNNNNEVFVMMFREGYYGIDKQWHNIPNKSSNMQILNAITLTKHVFI